jgi:hypothetical protein
VPGGGRKGPKSQTHQRKSLSYCGDSADCGDSAGPLHCPAGRPCAALPSDASHLSPEQPTCAREKVDVVVVRGGDVPGGRVGGTEESRGCLETGVRNLCGVEGVGEGRRVLPWLEAVLLCTDNLDSPSQSCLSFRRGE